MEFNYSGREFANSRSSEKVSAVAQFLQERLVHARAAEITTEVIKKSQQLFESFESFNPEISYAELVEQVFITLALSVQSLKTSRSVKGAEFEIMRLLFDQESSSLVDSGAVGLYIAKALPAVWEGIGYAGQDPDRVFASLDSGGRDELDSSIYEWVRTHETGGSQVLRLGHSYAESRRMQEQNWRVLRTPRSRQILFGAFAVKEADLVVLAYDDPTGHDERHEMNHLKPGLMVGELGYALDEGMTEHLAIMQGAAASRDTVWGRSAWSSRVRDVFDTAGRFSSYIDERKLLALITENGTNDIYQCLLRRYEDGDIQSAVALAVSLINRFGFDGYLQLYLATPDDSTSSSRVLLPSARVTKNLK